MLALYIEPCKVRPAMPVTICKQQHTRMHSALAIESERVWHYHCYSPENPSVMTDHAHPVNPKLNPLLLMFTATNEVPMQDATPTPCPAHRAKNQGRAAAVASC
jgi:hypothetical protein